MQILLGDAMSNYPPGMTQRDLAHVHGDWNEDDDDDVEDGDWEEMHNVGR